MTGAQEAPTPGMRAEAPTMLTIAQAEDVLQVSRWKLYQLIRSGELKSVKIGRSRRIPVTAVQALVARLQAEEVR